MVQLRKTILLTGFGICLLAVERPAAAFDLGLGLLKRKQSKPDPVSRGKQLTITLQSDPDEQKRKAAAVEMRGLDPRQNPELLPALTTALQKDPTPDVRIEAVETLGLLKPISQPAGLAMEAALTTDPDPKVREAIKAALWQYHLNGYRTPPGGGALATQTTEPKIAGKAPAGPLTTTSAKPAAKPGDVGFQPIRNLVGKAPSVLPLTPEPPLAKPKIPPVSIPVGPTAAPAVNGPMPMPEAKPAGTVPPVALPTAPSAIPLPTIPVPPLPFPAAPTPTGSLPLPTIPVPVVPILPPVPDKPF